jgi:hypothetical protein
MDQHVFDDYDWGAMLDRACGRQPELLIGTGFDRLLDEGVTLQLTPAIGDALNTVQTKASAARCAADHLGLPLRALYVSQSDATRDRIHAARAKYIVNTLQYDGRFDEVIVADSYDALGFLTPKIQKLVLGRKQGHDWDLMEQVFKVMSRTISPYGMERDNFGCIIADPTYPSKLRALREWIGDRTSVAVHPFRGISLNEFNPEQYTSLVDYLVSKGHAVVVVADLDFEKAIHTTTTEYPPEHYEEVYEGQSQYVETNWKPLTDYCAAHPDSVHADFGSSMTDILAAGVACDWRSTELTRGVSAFSWCSDHMTVIVQSPAPPSQMEAQGCTMWFGITRRDEEPHHVGQMGYPGHLLPGEVERIGDEIVLPERVSGPLTDKQRIGVSRVEGSYNADRFKAGFDNGALEARPMGKA